MATATTILPGHPTLLKSNLQPGLGKPACLDLSQGLYPRAGEARWTAGIRHLQPCGGRQMGSLNRGILQTGGSFQMQGGPENAQRSPEMYPGLSRGVRLSG